jgi:hypothetical protein
MHLPLGKNGDELPGEKLPYLVLIRSAEKLNKSCSSGKKDQEE